LERNENKKQKPAECSAGFCLYAVYLLCMQKNISSVPEKKERPWGTFETFAKNEHVTVKLLTVRAGEQLSVQYHNARNEYWRILAGNGEVFLGTEWRACSSGDEFVIAVGQQHSIRAGVADMVVLEIARGKFDEKDIVRVSDKYGREEN